MNTDVLEISASGDVVLEVSQSEHSQCFLYRVESSRLKGESRYFENLLSDRFSDGALVRLRHAELLKQYSKHADAPTLELPRIKVVDIGKTSKVKSIKDITADFLRLLHGLDLSTGTPPLPNVANLAVVADRFDALNTVSQYMKRRRILQTFDARTRGKALPEERIRQKLMLGVLLDHAQWVTTYSKRLILQGSTLWYVADEKDHEAETALWWDLPMGVEDELRYRRIMVLDTIGSIQQYFLKLYMSPDRQCKLGYDSSLACDSFQLGQMIKFFGKAGTLRLQSAIYDDEEITYYPGDIERLLESLRKCPEYQIDANHSHCGLRTRILPLLDWIQFWLERDGGSPDIGLCSECWKERRAENAWLDAKRPLLWNRSRLAPLSRKPTAQCSHRQFGVREMFTAVDRDWS